MGLLDDPKLMDRHEQIKRYSVEFKAGLAQSLPDPERHVDARHARRTLAHQRNWPAGRPGSVFAPNATGVNVNRLRAAIGATQDQPPGDFAALLRRLPQGSAVLPL